MFFLEARHKAPFKIDIGGHNPYFLSFGCSDCHLTKILRSFQGLRERRREDFELTAANPSLLFPLSDNVACSVSQKDGESTYLARSAARGSVFSRYRMTAAADLYRP